MKKVFRNLSFACLLVITGLSLTACGTTPEFPVDTSGTSEPRQINGSTATPTTEAEQTEVETPLPSEKTKTQIPPGSIALFATISGGKKSEFFRTEGGSISWDSTHYKFLRYIPEANMLDEFGWTTSQSYAKSYIYGITSGDWVYVVRRSSDTGEYDITRMNPRTGEIAGRSPTVIARGNWNFGFTILGDRVIYRTEIVEDLFGNRKGGGNVMAVEIGGSPVKLLDYADPNNVGSYYAIGEELITIVTSYERNMKVYDIYRVNPQTLAVGDLLFTYASKDIVNFYEGETALYWSEKDDATGDIKVIRFPPSEQPSYYLTISENSPQLVSIDESQGKVLIIYRDSSPESPFYNLVDLATDEIVELDVDPAFLSTYVFGNGQFRILD